MPEVNELVIEAYGTADKNYKRSSFTMVAERIGGCEEEFTKQPNYRIVSIGKDLTIRQERKFDFVVVPSKGYVLSEGDGTDHDVEYKMFCLHLKASPDIEKVQLYKGENLLEEAKVNRLVPDNSLYVFVVSGHQSLDYSDLMFSALKTTKREYFDEFKKSKKYRLVGLTKEDKIKEEQFFDFVHKQKLAVCHQSISTVPAACGPEIQEKSFQINMKYYYDIVRFKLYKGKKLLAEASVKE